MTRWNPVATVCDTPDETRLRRTAGLAHDRPMDSPPELLTSLAPKCQVELRRWRAADADLCFRMIRESLEHLRPWMPWASELRA